MSPQVDPSSLGNSSVCDLNDDCKSGCFCTHKIDIPYNKTIRLVLSSAGKTRANRRFAHPIHLHGHHFHIVAMGYGEYNTTTGESLSPTKDIVCGSGSTRRVCVSPSWKSGAEPNVTTTLDQFTITKDTVLLPGLGYVVIHFRSTNPGWWLLHCHMLPHQNEGMALVINEAEERQPPAPDSICRHGNFTWTVEEFSEALEFEYTSPSPTSSSPATAMSSTATAIPTSHNSMTTGQPPPTPTPTPTQLQKRKEEENLNQDAIAGITVGVVVFLALCIAAILVVAIVLVARGIGGGGGGGKGGVKNPSAESRKENPNVPAGDEEDEVLENATAI